MSLRGEVVPFIVTIIVLIGVAIFASLLQQNSDKLLLSCKEKGGALVSGGMVLNGVGTVTTRCVLPQ